MKAFISTGVHGVLDYVVGTVTAASPWLFGFNNAGSAALFIPLFIGVQQLNMDIFTNYRFGIWKVFPLQLHLIFDMFCGAILVCSPFFYGFTNRVFLPLVILGLCSMVLGIFTIASPFFKNKLNVFDQRGL